jgi:hypothetical protein
MAAQRHAWNLGCQVLQAEHYAPRLAYTKLGFISLRCAIAF